jgi:hypothetical protein
MTLRQMLVYSWIYLFYFLLCIWDLSYNFNLMGKLLIVRTSLHI